MEKDMDGKQTGLSATEENRTTLVCVDRYDRRIPEGRLYHPVRPDGGRFYGLVDFLRQADGLMDDARLPQRYTETRSFARVRQEQQLAGYALLAGGKERGAVPQRAGTHPPAGQRTG